LDRRNCLHGALRHQLQWSRDLRERGSRIRLRDINNPASDVDACACGLYAKVCGSAQSASVIDKRSLVKATKGCVYFLWACSIGELCNLPVWQLYSDWHDVTAIDCYLLFKPRLLPLGPLGMSPFRTS
jgi:hypothetical protein